MKRLKEELVEKNEQHAASAEKTKELLDEAESLVESTNMNLDALQAKTKTWHNKLAAINFFLDSEFLIFTDCPSPAGSRPSSLAIR